MNPGFTNAPMNETKRERQIPAEIELLNIAVTQNNGFVIELAKRLSYLFNAEPKPANPPTEIPILVPLASSIFGIRKEVEKSNEVLEYLLSSIEL